MSSQSSNQETPIVDFANFNPDTDMNFASVKVNDFGGKNVGILNKTTKTSLFLNTPLMLTWGVQENEFDDGKKSYDLALQFPSEDYQTEKTQAFLEKMKAYEQYIKTAVLEHSKEWMNKSKMSSEVVDALWTPMLKYPKDKDTKEFDYTRAPTLRVKLPFWDGNFNTEIYDMENTQLFPNDNGVSPMQLIPKMTNIAACLQTGGIWFSNGKFGTTWRLFQAVVKPRATLRGRCHISLDSDDKDKLAKQKVEDSEDEDDSVAVEDSDSEEEDKQDNQDNQVVKEPTPSPPAPKKKKRVVKRKKNDK